MKEFKAYSLPLGSESLTRSTSSMICSLILVSSTCGLGFFSSSSSCLACASLCALCSDSTSGSCSACFDNATLNLAGDCVCDDGFYNNGGSCAACDSSCETCSSSSNSNCLTCASDTLEVVGSSSASPLHCVSSCPSSYYPASASQCHCKIVLTLTRVYFLMLSVLREYFLHSMFFFLLSPSGHVS